MEKASTEWVECGAGSGAEGEVSPGAAGRPGGNGSGGASPSSRAEPGTRGRRSPACPRAPCVAGRGEWERRGAGSPPRMAGKDEGSLPYTESGHCPRRAGLNDQPQHSRSGARSGVTAVVQQGHEIRTSPGRQTLERGPRVWVPWASQQSGTPAKREHTHWVIAGRSSPAGPKGCLIACPKAASPPAGFWHKSW